MLYSYVTVLCNSNLNIVWYGTVTYEFICANIIFSIKCNYKANKSFIKLTINPDDILVILSALMKC